MPLISGSGLITFVNELIPQLTVVAIGWVARELYRTSKQIETNEKIAQSNRDLILNLHDLDAPEDIING